MDSDALRHFGGTGNTNIHPITLLFLCISLFIFFKRNTNKVIPIFIFLAILLPLNQRFIVFGLDLTVLRLLIITILIRILIYKDYQHLNSTSLDKTIVVFVIINILAFTLLWGTFGGFINRLGFGLNFLGTYIIFRVFIKSPADITFIIKCLCILSFILAVFMTFEQISGLNIFHIFGGISKYTPIRAGKLRSQGPFAHPILAGVFGATLAPLFFSFIMSNKRSMLYFLFGFISTALIAITSSSSGPLLALISGYFFVILWYFKKYIKFFIFVFLSTIVCLHIIMKAPVWALIDRVGLITGSSSYHRYKLIDEFIKRYDEWFFLGTKSTDHWGWMLWDVSNQYVSVGTSSGIVGLLIFLYIFYTCFKCIIKTATSNINQHESLLIWLIGASLFSHAVAFFGTAYFDQSVIMFYFVLACISFFMDHFSINHFKTF